MTRIVALSVACLLLGSSFAQADKKEDVAKAIKSLKAKDDKERIAAIQTIADVGKLKAVYAKDAVEPLTALLKSEDNGKVRAEAAKALGTIDPEEYAPVVEALAGALKDKEEVVVQASAGALGQLGPKGKEGLSALKELSEKLQEKINENKDDKAKAKKFQAEQKIVKGAIGAINGNAKK